MTGMLQSPAGVGLLACLAALLIAGYLIVSPGRTRLPRERRRPAETGATSPVTRAADAATGAIDRFLKHRGVSRAGALEQSGLRTRPQDFVFLVIVAALVAGTLGLVVAGPLPGVLLAAAAPVGARVALGVLASRRRAAFAEQLDDSLQLMASSLRAGHSLLQALASVAREAEEPTSVELSRVINETRVGRELDRALADTADRMRSDDFAWVTHAIAINREVGGNLAEVLDRVSHTIRERNQIRRQVKALAAEGKLSAYILMALPFVLAGFLAFTNPEYIGRFTESLAGYAMLGVSALLLVVGGVWLRKVVDLEF